MNPTAAIAPASDTSPSTTWPYAIARKPLEKWARERVTLRKEDDHIIASFRHSGSTCSNMGHPLTAILTLILEPLGPADYTIKAAACRKGEDDTGCAKMCSYIASPKTFMQEIDDDNPLPGMTLSAAIAWAPNLEVGGCLCSRESRHHKWRNAVQSIHFALNSNHSHENQNQNR